MTWTCPKCGREFKKTNQEHYCKKPPSMDEYIAAQDESVRPRLQRLRAIIHEAIPDAEERVSWSMPTFWKGTNLIHSAVFRKHIGLYPGEEAAAAFAEQLTDFAVNKGTIRLYHDQELPEALIREIAQWCYESYVK